MRHSTAARGPSGQQARRVLRQHGRVQRHRPVGQVHRLPTAAHLGVQRRTRHDDGAEVGDGVVHAEPVARGARRRRPGRGPWTRAGRSSPARRPWRRPGAGPARDARRPPRPPRRAPRAGIRRGARTRPAAPRSRGTQRIGVGAVRRGQSHGGSFGGRFPSAVRSSRPFDRPSSQAASSAAVPRTSSGPSSDPGAILPHRPGPRLVAGHQQQPREVGPRAERRGGVGEQLAQHRPGQVGERRAGVEVDRVDPHLARPQPQHVRREHAAAARVGDARRPRLLRHLPHGGGEPVRRRDQVGADLRGRAPGTRLDVRVALSRLG